MKSSDVYNGKIRDLLSDCAICPRSCHVDRLHGQVGFCGEGGSLRAARAALYYTEEPVISGRRGSGTVFFAGCNLGCIYCQNRQISRPGPTASVPQDSGSSDKPSGPGFSGGMSPDGHGGAVPCLTEISSERLAEIFFELEAQGAHNINLVTPEHFVPLIIPALRRAKSEGLSIPIVYNTGSYEKVEAVKALEGLVDIWLPDLKYVSSALSARHTGAADYFTYASAAIAEMVRQCPEPVFSDGSSAVDCPDDADDPLMIRGVLVRHLALPGCGEDSRAVLRYLYETYGNRIFISIMNQYTPMPQVLAKKLAGSLLPENASASFTGRITPENACASFTGRIPPENACASFTGSITPENACASFTGGIPPENACASFTGGIPDLCRTLSAEEYDSLVDYAIDLGIENGFIQESGTVSPSYIPVFDGTGL